MRRRAACRRACARLKPNPSATATCASELLAHPSVCAQPMSAETATKAEKRGLQTRLRQAEAVAQRGSHRW